MKLITLRLLGCGVLAGILFGDAGNSALAAPATKETALQPPAIAREFRAAWIATVANIDWPTKPGLSVADQKGQLLALFDKAQAMNLNAIVLQVRPACDAIYPSKLEPWSEYLTGAMGQPPEESYDPLEFAVEEAHARGLQLHAWFNPYRAAHPTAKSPLSDDHVSKKLPGAVVKYGDYLWLDPSNAEAEQHTLDVIVDVVRRYDVDGVHFDDYFYPYPIDAPQEESAEGEEDPEEDAKKPVEKVPFPDEESWRAYLANTPKEEQVSRDDWRRGHVNRLIRRVNEEVHREKPWVQFGVSPFGIWRPGHPKSVKGFDAYDQLYADSKLWLEKGWVDYFTPQLYWPIRSEGQSYPVLLDWWRRQNTHHRHLWPGLYTSRVLNQTEKGKGWATAEIIEQVRLAQGMRGVSGEVHFSMKALAQNRDGIADALRKGPYARPAVVPASPWMAGENSPPAKPSVLYSKEPGMLNLHLEPTRSPNVWVWGVQQFLDGEWVDDVVPGQQAASFAISTNELEAPRVVITAYDRLGRASEPQIISTQTE